MDKLVVILTALSALMGSVPFIRPRTRPGEVLLWVPKLLAGALAPVSGMIGAVAALVGLARRNWGLVGAGTVAAALAAKFVADMPDVDQALTGSGLRARAVERREPGAQEQGPLARLSPGGTSPNVERDLQFGCHAETGQPLLADLWRPTSSPASGLGLVYAHGSGWRVGGKGLGTRAFFRALTEQGHVVLDIAYTLWPNAGLQGMVAEVNQAILWLKEHGPAYGVNPERIVVMGGSAGAHLALMAAYTPGHPAFLPTGTTGDTSVRGVVAFYPPVDALNWEQEVGENPPVRSLVERISHAMLRRLFAVQLEDGRVAGFDHFISDMIGGSPREIPETYRLLSPIQHVSRNSPPTLLLQCSDDLFGLVPDVRRLHDGLRLEAVPSALLEFPHTEHGFDLLFPRISPPARVATRAVIEFLARLE